MLNYLNINELLAGKGSLKSQFGNALPCKHLEIANLVKAEKLQELSDAFPDEDWECWSMYRNEHAPLSKVCASTLLIPTSITNFLFELNSGPFLHWLEKVTGIDNLLPDPDFVGGGMHMTLPGGTLTPHTDFHVKDSQPRYRQLNLILYLTQDWKPEHQGCFELWDQSCTRVEKEIAPTFGACCLFKTDANSVHGFSKPVRGNSRRSIAVYYYTLEEDVTEYGGNVSTNWRTQTMTPDDTADGLRLWGQRVMWSLGLFFDYVSWKCQKTAHYLSSKAKVRGK